MGAVTSATGFSGWGGVWRTILGLLGAAGAGAGAGARRTGALGANFLPDLLTAELEKDLIIGYRDKTPLQT